MVDSNLFEKFKEIDKHFQLLPGADGHAIFVPRRNPAFFLGKAMHKLDSEIDFPAALKDIIADYKTIGTYLKNSHNASDLATRTSQIVVDTACCNYIGLKDDAGAVLAGSYSAHKREQMAKAITKNETLAGHLKTFKEFENGRKKMILHLRGPKGSGNGVCLPDKPPQPSWKDLFNGSRGGAIAIELDEITQIKEKKSFFNLVLEYKKKIS